MKQLDYQSNQLSSEELVLKAYRIAIEQKGLDARAYDLTDVTNITDCSLIVSGTSERHCVGIADRIQEDLKNYAETPNSVSGYQHGEWILLDYSNVIIHVFHESLRQFYKLEELWQNANDLRGDDELEKAAMMYRTKPL